MAGITVEPYVRYLGWHLGNMAPYKYDQYAAALRNFETEAQQLDTLPLSDKETVAALITWAYPVLVVGKLVYPMERVCTKVDSTARQSLRMARWSTMDAINMQLGGKGGIGMILPSRYLLSLHSKRYINRMNSSDSLTGAQLRPFEEWKGDQPKDSLSRRHTKWSEQPVQKADGKSGRSWPGMTTATKAYGEFCSKRKDLHEPKVGGGGGGAQRTHQT